MKITIKQCVISVPLDTHTFRLMLLNTPSRWRLNVGRFYERKKWETWVWSILPGITLRNTKVQTYILSIFRGTSLLLTSPRTFIYSMWIATLYTASRVNKYWISEKNRKFGLIVLLCCMQSKAFSNSIKHMKISFCWSLHFCARTCTQKIASLILMPFYLINMMLAGTLFTSTIHYVLYYP